MLAMFVLLLLALILAVAAMLWGSDSRDSIDSPEWERRAQFTLTHLSSLPHTPSRPAGKAVRASSSWPTTGTLVSLQPAAGTAFRKTTQAL